MTVPYVDKINSMNIPPSNFPTKGKGARCEDVTSLDSWCELEKTVSPVIDKLSKPSDDQLSSRTASKSNERKPQHYNNTDVLNSSKSKTKSYKNVGNSYVKLSESIKPPNKASQECQDHYTASDLKVKTLSHVSVNPSSSMENGFPHESTRSRPEQKSDDKKYSSDNPLTLNPRNLESLLATDIDQTPHKNSSHSLPFTPSLEKQPKSFKGQSGFQSTNSSLLNVKQNFLQNKSQSTVSDFPPVEDFCTSLDLTASFDGRLSADSKRVMDDKHRSSESIYSSTERSQSLDKPRNKKDFTGDLDQLIEQSEKVKTKLLSVWNNMKYGWTIKTKTQFRFDSPIYLLGKCYHIRKEDDVETDVQQPIRHRLTHPHLPYRMTEMESFKRDFSSRLWFTYRRDFPVLPRSTLTTDCGWGCMLRSGQMMLAQAFCDHFLGRDWRIFNQQLKEQELYHRQIIRWFGDFPTDQSPFSIHSLVHLGAKTGKRPGDWYGPASVAHILKDAIVKAYEYQPILNDIAIYVSQDCTVYKQDILDLCSNRRRSSTRLSSFSESPTTPQAGPGVEADWKRGVVILIPVRLGSDVLNPVYVPCLKSLLAQDCCLGIIGGKPRHSLYFIGWQEEKLIHLDPHYCQDVVDTKLREFPFNSYHCMSPRKMPFSKMDPSCTIGFYCKTKQEFNNFVEQTKEMVLEPKYKGLYPMFIFSEGSCGDLNLDLSVKEDRLLRVRHVQSPSANGKARSKTIESEEFVFL